MGRQQNRVIRSLSHGSDDADVRYGAHFGLSRATSDWGQIGNQTDRLAHSPGEPPAELARRFETRTAPMVTFGAGDTGAVVDLASG